jgi:hypothetical protein
MKFAVGMLTKKDLSLIVKDDRRDSDAEARSDQTSNEYLNSEWELPPDIK